MFLYEASDCQRKGHERTNLAKSACRGSGSQKGEIVGIGAHMKAGEPHAEIHALQMAGEKAKGLICM